MTHVTKRRRHDEEPVGRYRWLAAVVVVVAALGTALAFMKSDPLSSGFEVRAIFSTSNQVKGGSEVRIAGVQVGQVSGISAGPNNTTVVTMGINGNGLPLHDDATFTIKPRLALEGNGYVDVNPGSPAAPTLRSGATVPVSQTSVSVQIDQLLDTFDLPTRGALQRTVSSLSNGLGSGSQPSVSSAPGYLALRGAVRSLYSALPSVTDVAAAAQGTEPGDLTRAIGSSADVLTQLATSPEALAGIVTHYNSVFAALASQDRALADTIGGFDQVLKAAPPSLSAIDAALPTLTSFANDLRPALVAAPRSLRTASGLLTQFEGTVQPNRLGAVVSALAPIVNDLPSLEQRLQVMFHWSTPVTDCISSHVVPVLDEKVPDGKLGSGDPAWLDLMHAFTGFTSFASAVDANGGTVRMGVTVTPGSIGEVIPALGHVIGEFDNAEGVDPAWLGYGVQPPYRPDEPCASQPMPDLAARRAGAPDLPEEALPTVTRPSSRLKVRRP